MWVETEASAVEEDGGFEVLSVPEATDSSFDGHDFAVHSFGDGVCDSVGAVAHNISQTLPDCKRPTNPILASLVSLVAGVFRSPNFFPR